ncbi:MAG TPA: MBL fold metallo-hydrolase [Acidimicrobiia bacterium]|nr:MBL fold metallo-hydrolase [Acidimicrobiia bacterium]
MRLTVLGSGQDGGLPQAGARHRLDDEARNGEIPERTGPSLLVEHDGLTLLCDVSADFRIQWWKRTAPPDAIALTHAHIGHYAGLVHFGKEASAAVGVPVYATERMMRFLSTNAPWNALIDGGHLVAASSTAWSDLDITLIPVPHRGEYTDTVAVSVGGRALWLPDIDDWSRWPEAAAVIGEHRLAFLDATFWSRDEIAHRSIDDIGHPLVPDTMERFAGLETRIVLTHLNHTNPLCDPRSPESATAHAAGYEVASDGLVFEI